MKKNIEALWLGKPIISSMSNEDQEIFYAKSKELKNAYVNLEGRLDSEGIKLLNQYLRLQSEINDLERKDAFVSGFSLGVKLIVEGVED